MCCDVANMRMHLCYMQISHLFVANQELRQTREALQEQRDRLFSQLSDLTTRLQRLQQCNLSIRSDNDFLYTTATALYTLAKQHVEGTPRHDDSQLQLQPQLPPQQADAGHVGNSYQQELVLERFMQQLQAQHNQLQQLLVAFRTEYSRP